MTRSEQRFLEQVKRQGHAWFVPAQSRMVQRLAQAHNLTITNERRFDVIKNIHERKVVDADKRDAVLIEMTESGCTDEAICQRLGVSDGWPRNRRLKLRKQGVPILSRQRGQRGRQDKGGGRRPKTERTGISRENDQRIADYEQARLRQWDADRRLEEEALLERLKQNRRDREAEWAKPMRSDER